MRFTILCKKFPKIYGYLKHQIPKTLEILAIEIALKCVHVYIYIIALK